MVSVNEAGIAGEAQGGRQAEVGRAGNLKYRMSRGKEKGRGAAGFGGGS